MDLYVMVMKSIVFIYIFVLIFLIEPVVGQTTKYNSNVDKDIEDIFGSRGYCTEEAVKTRATVCRSRLNHEQWVSCCARGVNVCCPCPENIWNCWYIYVAVFGGFFVLIMLVTVGLICLRMIQNEHCENPCYWFRTPKRPRSRPRPRPERTTMLSSVV